MPSLHQAEHLAGHAAHLQRLAVELALEGIQGPHDIADGPVAVLLRMRRLGFRRLFPHTRIGLLDHHFAEIDSDQIVLKDVMVEHVLGSLAQIDNPLGHVRRLDPVGHVLGIDRTRRMVVPANAANAAGDEMGVPGVLVLHEDAVTAKDRRRAMALDDLLSVEVDLRVDAEASDDAGDRVP